MEIRKNTLLEKQGLTSRAQSDERRRVSLPPVAVTWTSEEGVTNADALLKQRSVQVSLHNQDCCELKTENAQASILLDYGKELVGGLMLSVGELTGADEVELRVRFGESATEAMSELGGVSGATNDHARRDWKVSLRFLSSMFLGETGFRFVRIDLLTPNASVQVCGAKAVLIYRDLPYLGSFCCNDELLNQIWETGAYTVHLNMQEYIWDGVKRDRLVWIGDMHPETSTIQAVFGDQKLIRDSLDFVTAQTPATEWMNDIPTYSMWWIVIQHDYFMQFGNREYLARQLPYLKELVKNLSSYIGEDGKDITPGNRFVDWQTRGHDKAVDAGIQALHILAMQASVRIFAELGETELAAKAEEDCARLKQYKVDPEGFKQSASLAVLAGLLDAKQTNDTLLRQDGAEGFSTFMGLYILMAMAKADDYTGALDMIREYWGGMLKMGATTFWEDFELQWMKGAAPINRLPKEGEIDFHGTYGKFCYTGFRHSLCHGWASGPTAWLSESVLGVKILEPGCRTVQVSPHLGDLEWVKGTYPTPYGTIELEHRKMPDGTVRSSIQAPREIKIVQE